MWMRRLKGSIFVSVGRYGYKWRAIRRRGVQVGALLAAFHFLVVPAIGATITATDRTAGGDISPGFANGNPQTFNQTNFSPFIFSNNVTVTNPNRGLTGQANATIDSGHFSPQALSFPTISGGCSASSTGSEAAQSQSQFHDQWYFTLDMNSGFDLSGNLTLGNQETGVNLYALNTGTINGVSGAILTISNPGPFDVTGQLTTGTYEIYAFGGDLITANPGTTSMAPAYFVNATVSVPEPMCLLPTALASAAVFGLRRRNRNR